MKALTRTFSLALFATALISCATAPAKNNSDITAVGAGGYRTQPAGIDSSPPDPKYRTPAMQKRAAPTNQWYSSVIYQQWGETVYATPLALKPTPSGFEVSLPTKSVIPTGRKDVEIHYPHRADLTFMSSSIKPTAALLSDHSDWTAKIDLVQDDHFFRANVSHGSPFVYFSASKGNVALVLGDGFTAKVQTQDKRTLVISGNSKTYAAFAPTGGVWSTDDNAWSLALPAGKKYFSAAALPNDQQKTIQRFAKSAHTVIEKTTVDWFIDAKTRTVTTDYRFTTKTLEGTKAEPIIGLYPHHYHDNPTLGASFASINSIRGEIKLFQQSHFKTQIHNRGFVPYWPTLQTTERKDWLETQLSRDSRRARKMMLEIGQGPYWQGKGLQRITQLMNVAHSEGDIETRDELLQKLTKRAESWLSGQSRKTYFFYDKKTGTVVSYPEEYDAVKDMNDHHFHYGYWIRAAAEIGLFDPDWIKNENWGGMINLLIEDIATTKRGSSRFPFLRNFDPYEGHSWASGVGRGPDGNNQESSSEAINAWASLILWGSLTNQPKLVELGTYLYNTEITATQFYWFDVHETILPEEYLNEDVCIVFGAKLVHYTWWIDEPRQIHGINLLPITPSSTYLGEYPDYVTRNLEALDKEIDIYASRGKAAKPHDIWQDLFAQFLALADPDAGFEAWDEWGSFELGDTRSHALYWLTALQEMGTPDLTINANTPFYAVFFNSTTQQRTYLSYNASKQSQTVTFSDGTALVVQPGQLAQKLK